MTSMPDSISMDDIPDDLIYRVAFAFIPLKDGTVMGDIWLIAKWGDKYVMQHKNTETAIIAHETAPLRITYL